MASIGKEERSLPRRVTMKDVADRCGVSLSTVSLVLSGDQRIPPGTTRQVLEVVKALGYRPNVIARNLARQRSKTLAVILPDPEAKADQRFFAEALKGVYAETARQGYRLILDVATPQFMSRRFYLRLLKENSADGLLYLGAGLRDEFLADKELLSYPFLLVGGYLDDPHISYAAPDEESGALAAVRHLASLGHARIGHIGGPALFSSVRDQAAGYRRGLEEKNLAFDTSLTEEIAFHPEAARQAALRLLERKATALFAGTDLMAAGALAAVKESGLRPGRDIAVVGVGDADAAEWLDPALTTVRFRVRDMAAEGTRRVIEGVQGEASGVFQKKYPAELIVRKSCGAA
jgi:DNA-binding LacI/PurR family transcriptional regulator